MIAEEIILGLVSIAMGVGMLYYTKSKNVSDVVKSFFSTWWIKSERVNKAISGIFGLLAVCSGVVYFVAGIVGWDIWPR